MIDQTIEIATPDGSMTTFISHPERGGPFPIIIFYMDAPGIREELRDMVRRLATSGYYVVLPNLYYRTHVLELGLIPSEEDAPLRKRMFELRNSLTIPMVMQDTKALLDFMATQEVASKAKIGTVGYCMSGRNAMGAASDFPERVNAAASIYGTRLITDQPDSPHLTARNEKAEMYVACAEFDIYAPLDMIEQFNAALKRDGVNAEVELYPKAHHGFAFPKRSIYDRDSAERHWERL